MKSVNELNIELMYSSDENNILEEFYLPVLSKSKLYRRAVGYFSSGILVAYISSIKDLYTNGGKMKLIISPSLSNEDLFTLSEANELVKNNDIDQVNSIKNQLESYLYSDDEDLVLATELFFLLIVGGVLEVKVATPKTEIGIFHEKIGIFDMVDGNKVSITGSNNETYSSITINFESFNTYCSWKLGQNDYIKLNERNFEKYWNNRSNGLDIRTLDEAFVHDIFEKIPENTELAQRFNKLTAKKENAQIVVSDRQELDFQPFDYQKNAAELLIKHKCGILDFATGSGKTKLSIYFMEELKKIKSSTFFLIVVPDRTLMEQWSNELAKYNDYLLKCYSETNDWLSQFRNMVDIHNLNEPINQVVLVTNQTMFLNGENSKFLRQLKRLEGDLILIVDEIHNWSTSNRVRLMPEAEYKVGLSATPFNSPMTEYDMKIQEHFKGIIASYSLKNAIDDEKLVPYNYYPIFVSLTDEEKSNYNELSHKIAKLQGSYEKTKNYELKKSLEMLKFQRARIVYGAIEKIETLEKHIINRSIETESLIIYCGATSYNEEALNESEYEELISEDSLSQLELVNNMLHSLDVVNVQYTQKEVTKERERIIELFENKTYATMVAIKCLDEGVDIPSIKNAVILASSSNKREFVQRRGRVLRKDGSKTHANIYDFIVRDDERENSHLNKVERTRFMEFASLAKNKEVIYAQHKNYIEGDVYGED